jgi:hypothetical protein
MKWTLIKIYWFVQEKLTLIQKKHRLIKLFRIIDLKYLTLAGLRACKKYPIHIQNLHLNETCY